MQYFVWFWEMGVHIHHGLAIPQTTLHPGDGLVQALCIPAVDLQLSIDRGSLYTGTM